MTGADERRLERYDLFAAGVRSELERTEGTMAELRTAGRAKSATYRQLLANRSVMREIVARMEDAGL